MAYPVENIINVNLLLTPSGLGYANFATGFIVARPDDLVVGATFDVDTYREYASLAAVGEDFETDSDTYYMATRWFANTPKPRGITVWMWDNVTDTDVVDTLNKMINETWRYWVFVPSDVATVEANAIALSDWSDANIHPVPITLTDPAVADPQDDTDVASVLKAKGNRHMFVGYVPASIVATDPTQKYAMVQLAASFNKFRPNSGTPTAITGEYQVLPGVVGADGQISNTGYAALDDKQVVFFSKVELADSDDASRVIDSRSMSSFGEFIDDVVNLDVLRNYIQVDGYNYIAGAASKRPLTPRGYAGLLAVINQTGQNFYNNGVLGEGTYTDPITGQQKVSKQGFVNLGEPNDVLGLTTAQKRERQFPETTVIAILSRAGHTATINVEVA